MRAWNELGLRLLGWIAIALLLLLGTYVMKLTIAHLMPLDAAGPIAPLSARDLATALAAPEVQRGLASLPDVKQDAATIASFTTAARNGNPVAQSYLGYLSYMGHGLTQDDQVAAGWYRRAALQGFIDAELRLGELYAAGRDLHDPARSLPHDDAKAILWLQRAADQGSTIARDEIGRLRLMSARTDADIATAREQFQRPAEQGDPANLALMCWSYRLRGGDAAAQQHWCDLAGQHPVPDEIQVLSSDAIPMVPPAPGN